MVQPTRHPKTGIYRVRLAIPAPLRDTAQQLYGVKSEFKVNLQTRDAAEAKRKAPAAVEQAQSMLMAVRQAASSAPGEVTEPDIQAIAGEVYSEQSALFADDPGPIETWASDCVLDQIEQVEPTTRDSCSRSASDPWPHQHAVLGR
jgi:hypothetical protein